MFLGGCPCCGKKGPCWKCYGKYSGEWPPCSTNRCITLINEEPVLFPSFISFRSSLSLGSYQEGTQQDYNEDAATEWLANLDFRFILSAEEDDELSTYSVGSAFNWLDCKQLRPDIWGGGFTEYQDDHPSRICGQDNQAGPFSSEGNIGLSCIQTIVSGIDVLGGLWIRSCFGETSFSLLLLESKIFNIDPTSLKQSFTIDGTGTGLYATLTKCTAGPFGGLRGAAYSVNGTAEISFDFLPEETVGSCCLRTGECLDSSAIECIDECGIFTPDITCGENPCKVIDADEYQCFDAPPEEDGWEPVSKCHPDEESCDAACPPDTPPPGGRTMTTTTIGPGTHLKNMLAWFNIKAKEKGCKCAHMEKKMNQNGPQWCRDHMQEIVDHLAKEAKKRKLPFVRLAAEKLVRMAIRKAEKDSA